jgi:hypothetical protein
MPSEDPPATMESPPSFEDPDAAWPRGSPMTTILRTAPAHRALHPIVMTATLVAVPTGAHGPTDLPVTVDRAPTHSRDSIALWVPQPIHRAA